MSSYVEHVSRARQDSIGMPYACMVVVFLPPPPVFNLDLSHGFALTLTHSSAAAPLPHLRSSVTLPAKIVGNFPQAAPNFELYNFPLPPLPCFLLLTSFAFNHPLSCVPLLLTYAPAPSINVFSAPAPPPLPFSLPLPVLCLCVCSCDHAATIGIFGAHLQRRRLFPSTPLHTCQIRTHVHTHTPFECLLS